MIPSDAPPVAVAAATPTRKIKRSADGSVWGTGRRKSAIARVRVKAGSGKFTINEREVDHYLTEIKDRTAVRAPLSATNSASRWDVFATVRGGGHTGQAGAILLALARALVGADAQFEPTLRDAGYLSRDSRVVERKKYGRRKARRRFQFSKR